MYWVKQVALMIANEMNRKYILWYMYDAIYISTKIVITFCFVQSFVSRQENFNN